MGKPQPGQRPGRRVTLTQAAEILGLSRDTVRMRVRRGSLESEKGEDGRVYVFLEPDQARAQDARPQAEDETSATWATLVDELRDQVHYLRDQHRREQDAHAEARRIIAALAQRIPEIEAPSTASHSPQERPEKPSPTETPAGAQEGAGHPQQLSRWSAAATHNLRWWEYVLGILIAFGSNSAFRGVALGTRR